MCGIAGIIGRIDETSRRAVGLMNRAIAHRGPDAEGYWESPVDAQGRGVLLAHRRLSILDLSPAGAQPMIDDVHGDVVVLNGEIYNYQALRRELASRGQELRSTGDTAALLRVLALYGRDGIAKLRGMFAFAHWSPVSQTLALARDALGIKPLYVARNPDAAGTWSLMFASEVRALLASGLLGTPRLDPAAVSSLVWNGFITGPGTAISGIETLWPGEYMVLDRSGSELSRARYWRPPAPQGPRISEEELGEVLADTVKLHLASDVPIGVFLSGGIDSSAVANLARRQSKDPVQTFTLAFEEAEYDESGFSDAIAQAIGTKHRRILLTEEHFVAGLEKALDCLDQPTFDGLNTYFMSHAVRDAGFKVALVGTGGDELFGGYTSFRDLPRLAAWGRRTQAVPMVAKQSGARLIASLLQPGAASGAQQTRWAKLPDMVARGDDLIGLYQLAYALFLPQRQRELLRSGPAPGIIDGLSSAMHSQLREEIAGRSPLEAISILEQRLFLGERLLRDTDATSMSASIEIRLPLVDQTLLEAVMRLDESTRYQPIRAKSALRRIGLKGLDPALFDRPKSGFVLPYDKWLRSRLGKQIGSVLMDRDLVARAGLEPEAVAALWNAFQHGAPGLYWTRIWAIYVLVRWCQRHGATMS